MMKQILPFALSLTLAFLLVAPAAHAKTDIPLAAGICLNKAETLFNAGKTQKAVQALEGCKAKGHDHPYIHFALGTYYLALNRTKKAGNCYEAAARLQPDFNAAWLNLAKCRYDSSDHARAAHAFEKGYDTAKTPKPIHLYYAAVCRFQADQAQKALTIFNRLLKQHPKDVKPAWKETLVHILFSLDRYKQALPFIETLAAGSKKEKRVKWREILLQQYLSLDMHKKALTLATRLTRIEPLEPKWWKALTHIHLHRNRTKSGLTALVIYGFLTPLTIQEKKLAADLYLSLGIPKKAAQLYETTLGDTPKPHHLRQACQALFMAHELDKAMACIEKGLARRKDKELAALKAHILSTRELTRQVNLQPQKAD